MATNKHIEKIISVIVAIAVVLCFAAMFFSGKLVALAGGTGVDMEYETVLFDTSSPISVNIIMDESDWQDMLGNASSEAYYKCGVEIGGQVFDEVGIRPKGNTSLMSIASDPDTDRYSFKLEFDQYVDGQTCFGLDKLILNNNYADATNMKEALIYDMYQYIGADAPFYNYASIYVNGEYWGVYLALEAVEDSFLLRTYGASNGELYKPDNMDMGGGGGDFGPQGMGFNGVDSESANSESAVSGNMIPPDAGEAADKAAAVPGFGDSASSNNGVTSSENAEIPGRGDLDVSDRGGGPGGFSMGGDGADLNYLDDDLDSYSSIWDGEVTNSDRAGHQRVVEALKGISEGNGLEEYMDIDNLLKYMAVHVFSVNDDSLTGTMAHNYYLYEENGQLNIIPWDYNLSFGGMDGAGTASDVINDPIDGAFSGTNFFDTLMENKEYCEQYHSYLRQLADEYINGGAFDEFYTRTRAILDDLVESDPTAFYTYEEYSDAADTLYEVVKLRGESIKGQAEGTIPSTQSGQQEDSSALVETGNLDLSIMGTMDMGNGGMGGGGGFGDFGGGFNFGGGFVGDGGFGSPQPEGSLDEDANGMDGSNGAISADEISYRSGSNMVVAALSANGGPSAPEMQGGPDAGSLSDGQSQSPQINGNGGESEEETTAADEEADFNVMGGGAEGQTSRPGQPGREGMDSPGSPSVSSGNRSNSTVTKNLVDYGVSFAVLILALVFASLFKRKSRQM